MSRGKSGCATRCKFQSRLSCCHWFYSRETKQKFPVAYCVPLDILIAYTKAEDIHEWMVDMDAIHICGGNTLCGEVDIQGSKNGTLPLLAASVLVKGKTVLENCPMITDVEHMIKLLECAGCKVVRTRRSVEIDASVIQRTDFPLEHTGVMRSSVMLLGAMLGRMGEVSTYYPGGCVIGERPIDMHIKALSGLGVCFADSQMQLKAVAKTLTGARVTLAFPSVGATENVILAAVLAKGKTVLEGCAREPEIVELCNFLNCAGARITGAGGNRIVIEGVEKLQEICYRIMPDRIVAGTYLLAGVMTKGIVVLNHAPVEQMQELFRILQLMGADLAIARQWVCMNGEHAHKAVANIKTAVYPGFPTDLQSAFMAAFTLADGCSIIEENIFESRFKIVPELRKMGADIHVMGNRAMICGVPALTGCKVKAMELRGGAALVLAGLAASGTTIVENRQFIERGYEDICRDLKALGAKVSEENEK